MPVIPKLEEQNQLPGAPPATDVSPERFGRDAAALSQFGGAIGEFGGRLMQARKSAMEADAVATRRNDDVIWLANTENELRLNYQKTDAEGNPILNSDGTVSYDAEGFSNALKERLDARFNEGMESLPTGDAQRAYRSSVQPMFERSYIGGLQWENVTRADTYRKNNAARVSANANFLINNPNLENTRNTLDALKKDIDSQIGTILSPGEARDLYKAGAKTYVDALFRGYAQSPTKAKEGIAILNHISELAPRDPATGELLMSNVVNYPEKGEKISEGVVSGGGMRSGMFGSGIDPRIVQESLSPDDIDRIRQRLLSVKDEGDKFKATELRSQLNSYRSLLTDPNPVAMNNYFSQQQKRSIAMGFEQLAKDKKISQAEADEAAITIALGESYATVRNLMWSMAPSKMAQYDQLLEKEYVAELKLLGRDGTAFSYEHRRQYNELNAKIKKNIMSARKKDPSGYIESHFSTNASGSIGPGGIPDARRIEWRMAMAKHLEMGAPPLTGGEASNLIKGLKKNSEKNPEAAAATIAAIRENPHSGEIMAQLTSGKHGLDKSFMNAYYAASDSAALSMIENGNKENREGLLKSAAPDSVKAIRDLSKKEFESGALKPFAAAGSRTANVKFANGMREAIVLEALKIKGTSVDSISDEDATKQAIDTIVHENYHIKGTVFIPRRLGETVIDEGNVRNIEGEMQAIYNKEYQKKVGITPPRGQQNTDPAQQERSLQLLIEKGHWATKPDGRGAHFVVPFGKRWIPLPTKTSREFSIDFAKTAINPSAEAIEYNKPWFEKILK